MKREHAIQIQRKIEEIDRKDLVDGEKTVYLERIIKN